MRSNKHLCQRGLTLLEVLIALSIFSMIGIASFRVLTTVIETEKVGERHSQELSSIQKSITILDRDLQQIISRDIRSEDSKTEHYLIINSEQYPLIFTRGGRRNPLLLPRSDLQRVAYDIGPHPKAGDVNSAYYQDESQYLRRHLWSALDGNEDAGIVVQALMPGIKSINVAVLTESGRYIEWPKRDDQGKVLTELNGKSAIPVAIEFSFEYGNEGQLTRIYQVF